MEVRGDSGVVVRSVTHDSRRVEPGTLFCCVPGSHHDGHDFAPAALDAGASALLVERWLDLDAPQLRVPKVRDAMGPLAARVHGDPSRELAVVGVTGTNGKTTVTHLLEAIARAAGTRPGVVGTVGVRVDGEAAGVGLTTPEATDLQELLARMRDSGVGLVAVEVSSHALATGRVEGTWFAVSVFTNLSHDHLDFHGSLDDYFEAKASLFDPRRTGRAVVNVADPRGAELARRCAAAGVPVMRFAAPAPPAASSTASGPSAGLSSASGPGGAVPGARRSEGPPPDLIATDVVAGRQGTVATLTGPAVGRDLRVRSPLVGRFNVENLLAAAGAALTAGFDVDAVVAGLESPLSVPGRFERIDRGQDFTAVVDYAHTPDALVQALGAAREIAGEHRVLVVFGCGGERDHAKRPEMGRVAAELADVVVVTSDNPRGEDPVAIADEILEGLEGLEGVEGVGSRRGVVELDRGVAIARAVREARRGDVLVVAGKGHETGQSIAGETHPFDDRLVVADELSGLSELPESEGPTGSERLSGRDGLGDRCG